MKKTLLLCALLAATATDMYARRWDFTNWSAATIENLKTHKDWTDDEKGDGSSNVTGDKCLWQSNALASAVDADGNLLANGVVISELEGLRFTALNAKSVAIALDYQTTTDANKWGPYQGSQYFWLAGASSKVTLRIPDVEPGTTVKIGIESHKLTDARGVDAYVGSTKLSFISGNASSYPTTYEEYEYEVPADIAAEGETVNVDLKPSNGCHLYYIIAGDDTEKTEEELRVAYVYDATYASYTSSAKIGGIDNDPIFQNVISSFDGVAIDLSNAATEGLTTEAFQDSLLNFDAVVLGEGLASGNTYAKSIVDIVNMVPIVNMKSFMYKSGVWGWGAGVNPSPKVNSITVNEAYLEDELFEDVSIEDGVITLFDESLNPAEITSGNLVQAYTAAAGSLIADDEVLATAGGNNAIHRHGTRNTYILIPISSDNIAVEGENALSEDAFTLLTNAIKIVAATKSKVQNASAPVISQSAGDNVTTVTLTSSTTGAKIYYTLDGTEPTEASTLYTEAFDVTVDSTVVKAITVAQGYLQSATSSATISVKGKLAAPTITVDGAKVTITAAEGDIYYNISGSTTQSASQLYTEAFEAPFSCNITAFAVSDTKLTSDAVESFVTVASDIYRTEIAHVTFNNTEGWGYSSAKRMVAAYNAMSTIPDSTLVGEGDEATWEYTYKVIDTVATEFKAEAINWTLSTYGQQLYYIVDYNNTLSVEGGNKAYGYASVFDNKDYTKYGIGFQNIKHVREEGVANAFLTSGEKYQGPFEVALTFTQAVGSGTNQTLNVKENDTTSVYLYARFEVAVSADGETWNVVDTLTSAANKMVVRKTTVYEGNEAVQLRIRSLRPLNLISSSMQKAVLYDVVLNGEGVPSAIETIDADKVATAADATAPVYDLLGRRVMKLESGKFYLQGGKKFIVK